MKFKAKANGCLGPSSLPPYPLPRDEQAGTESPTFPSLAGMLVTLHVADVWRGPLLRDARGGRWVGKLGEGHVWGGGS